jgi:dTDP-4-amino-4,6-dideoxygalactose transaminase
MALELQPGDEVIVPAFTYVATAEVIALLGLKPIMVDVDPNHFNVRVEDMQDKVTPKTKAIVPVHLFGQSAPMEDIMAFANILRLPVIEDNAQAIGCTYRFSDGSQQKTGTIGDIGCTSFYPSKNLGAYGDGGAISTNSEVLGSLLTKMANHGQESRYYHDYIGVNSRLDSIQAAILNIKLKHLDEFAAGRRAVADTYDEQLKDLSWLETPYRVDFSDHVFHQYTLKIHDGKRDALKAYLDEKDIPNMIYYPVPLYKQKAYSKYYSGAELPNTEMLCDSVLSLPMHPDLTVEQQEFITETIIKFE